MLSVDTVVDRAVLCLTKSLERHLQQDPLCHAVRLREVAPQHPLRLTEAIPGGDKVERLLGRLWQLLQLVVR